jgi:hypothetical protein
MASAPHKTKRNRRQSDDGTEVGEVSGAGTAPVYMRHASNFITLAYTYIHTHLLRIYIFIRQM